MTKLMILFFITFLFTSCATKNNAFKYFDKGDVATKGIQFTKKIDIIKDKEVQAIFMVTYLNRIDNDVSKTTGKDIFFVTTYFPNSQFQDVSKNGYDFLLNGKNSISLEEVDKNNENFKDLMLKNHWGKYYLVKFDSIEKVNNLNFQITNQISNNSTLNFEK